MKITYYIILFLVLYSCNNVNSNIKLTKGERIFIDQILKQKEYFKKGNQIIFILNASSCQPCEDRVKQFYKSKKWQNITKTFVIPDNRIPTIDEYNYLIFNKTDLARYGLIRANGTVILLQNGSCTLLESIDVTNINNIENKIVDLIFNFGIEE